MFEILTPKFLGEFRGSYFKHSFLFLLTNIDHQVIANIAGAYLGELFLYGLALALSQGFVVEWVYILESDCNYLTRENMKKQILKLIKSTKANVGFTMIELLIVIAILGILAVAVLSAINPIEQINRGRDTGSRSDAEQLLSAIDRYNAFQGYYPWKTGASDVVAHAIESNLTPWTLGSSVLDNGGVCPVSEKLSTAVTGGCIGSDELKNTFFARVFDTGYNHLKIYNDGTQGASTYVCFAPKSKAFVTEAAARVTAGLPADYPAEAYDPASGGSSTVLLCGDDLNCVCLP